MYQFKFYNLFWFYCFSVYNLQLEIQKILHIPVDKQILLISGGQYLESTKRLGSYPAGADTNPYFLFNRTLFTGDFEAFLKQDVTVPPFIGKETETLTSFFKFCLLF